jgi:hypothetical protein
MNCKCGKPIDEHNGEQLAYCVAVSVMGWKLNNYRYWEYTEANTVCWSVQFRPDKHIADAWKVEARIEELGLRNTYSGMLEGIVKSKPCEQYLEHTWLLIHASPEDRCKAAIASVEGEE